MLRFLIADRVEWGIKSEGWRIQPLLFLPCCIERERESVEISTYTVGTRVILSRVGFALGAAEFD